MTPPRRRLVVIVTAALLVAAIAFVTTLALSPRTAQVPTAGRQSSDQPVDSSATPSPSGTPVPSATGTAADEPADEADAAASAAVSAVTSVVTATNTLLASPGTVPKDLAKYTGGFVEGELRALAAERESLGYTQVGTAVITSITTARTNLDGDPPTIVLNVCIDSSGVDVLDASGASLKASLYDPGHPVLNVYGAQLTGGSWKIISHSLPSPDTHNKKEPCS